MPHVPGFISTLMLLLASQGSQPTCPAKACSTRIDENIIFRPLDRGDLRQIAKLQLDRVQKRLDDRSGVSRFARGTLGIPASSFAFARGIRLIRGSGTSLWTSATARLAQCKALAPLVSPTA